LNIGQRLKICATKSEVSRNINPGDKEGGVQKGDERAT